MSSWHGGNDQRVFASILVVANRKIFSVHGEQLDIHSPEALGTVVGTFLSADAYELFVRTAQSLARISVTLVATPAGSDTVAGFPDKLGQTVLALPADGVLVWQGEMGAQGPFGLPAGPGLYQVSVWADLAVREAVSAAVSPTMARTSPAGHGGDDELRALDGREGYYLEFVRIGDSPAEPEDEDE